LEPVFKTLKVPMVKARPAGNGTAFLVHIYPSGPYMGSRYPVPNVPVTLGRGGECGIAVPDNSVSRQHARVEPRDDGYHVVDLGSTNGTFVNDEPVADARLGDGDYLRIGGVIYRFLAGGNVEAEYHEELYLLTIIDPLTGAHNRRYLLELLEHGLARVARHGRPLALILLDIDRFKAINDEHGHLAGDVTLRELAARIRRAVRKDELFARYGGEEFALLLPEADREEALRAAERFRLLVGSEPFEHEGRSFPVTVSLGVAVAEPGSPLTTAGLIERADAMLYQAKREGRNCVRG
jgi:diguanylate cyclase (GGDEF)-like protein